MRISGHTPEGRPVIADCYHLCGTHGLPLGILTDKIESNLRGVIDWEDFIQRMRAEGANDRTIRARILEAVEYPPSQKAEFTLRLDRLLSLSSHEVK